MPFNLLQNTVEEQNQQTDEPLGGVPAGLSSHLLGPVYLRVSPGDMPAFIDPRAARISFWTDPFSAARPTRSRLPHYRYAVYDNARTFISATTQLAGRSGLDVDAWCRVRGECQVLNEWMKRGTPTLFVERELEEPLNGRTYRRGFARKTCAGAGPRFV
jgi:hypothetical protein